MPRPPRWLTFAKWTAGMLTSALVLMFIVANCIPERSSSKERHNRVRCPAQLKQIGRALAAYAQDHNGALPPGLDALIAHDLVKPDLLICPSSADECAVGTTREEILADFAKPGRCSYLYFGAGMQRPSPTAVIACDHPMNHEGEGIFVLYGSGAAKWVPAAQAQQLLAGLRPGYVWPRFNAPPPTTQP